MQESISGSVSQSDVRQAAVPPSSRGNKKTLGVLDGDASGADSCPGQEVESANSSASAMASPTAPEAVADMAVRVGEFSAVASKATSQVQKEANEDLHDQRRNQLQLSNTCISAVGDPTARHASAAEDAAGGSPKAPNAFANDVCRAAAFAGALTEVARSNSPGLQVSWQVSSAVQAHTECEQVATTVTNQEEADVPQVATARDIISRRPVGRGITAALMSDVDDSSGEESPADSDGDTAPLASKLVDDVCSMRAGASVGEESHIVARSKVVVEAPQECETLASTLDIAIAAPRPSDIENAVVGASAIELVSKAPAEHDDSECSEDGGNARFAWMESADEECSSIDCEKPDQQAPPPIASEVETLGQMLRLATHCKDSRTCAPIASSTSAQQRRAFVFTTLHSFKRRLHPRSVGTSEKALAMGATRASASIKRLRS